MRVLRGLLLVWMETEGLWVCRGTWRTCFWMDRVGESRWYRLAKREVRVTGWWFSGTFSGFGVGGRWNLGHIS